MGKLIQNRIKKVKESISGILMNDLFTFLYNNQLFSSLSNNLYMILNIGLKNYSLQRISNRIIIFFVPDIEQNSSK